MKPRLQYANGYRLPQNITNDTSGLDPCARFRPHSAKRKMSRENANGCNKCGARIARACLIVADLATNEKLWLHWVRYANVKIECKQIMKKQSKDNATIGAPRKYSIPIRDGYAERRRPNQEQRNGHMRREGDEKKHQSLIE